MSIRNLFWPILGGDVMEKRKVMEAELITRKQAFEEVIPSLDRLQEQLEAGAEIKWQDGKWMLIDDGGVICYGANIRQMLVNLIFTVC